MTNHGKPENNDLPDYLPRSGHFKLANSPFYWIARINAKYGNRLDDLLKSAELNTAKWRVLMCLTEYGQLSMSEIAKHVVAKLPTITKTIYRMQDAGMVETRPGRFDARVTEVAITPLGEHRLEQGRDITSRNIENALHGFDDEEVRQLTGKLERIFKNMDGI